MNMYSSPGINQEISTWMSVENHSTLHYELRDPSQKHRKILRIYVKFVLGLAQEDRYSHIPLQSRSWMPEHSSKNFHFFVYKMYKRALDPEVYPSGISPSGKS